MSQSVFARLRWIPVVPSPASQYSVPYMPMRKLRQILARRSFLDWFVFAGLLALSLYAGNRLSSGTTWIDARAKIYQAFTVFGRNDRLPQRTAVVLLDDTDYWTHTSTDPHAPELAGRAPTNRAYLAHLIDALVEAHVGLIVLDIDLRSPNTQPGTDDLPDYKSEDDVLFQSIRNACAHNHQIVLASELVSSNGTLGVARNIYDHANFPASCVRQGYIELPRDIRRVPATLSLDANPEVDSLSLAAVKAVDWNAYQTAAAEGSRDFPYSEFLPLSRFNSSGNSQTRFTGRQFQSPDQAALTAKLLNRIVLIGADWHTLAFGQGSYADRHPTPAGDLPGVILHANYIEAALQNGVHPTFPESLAITLEVLLVLSLSLLGMLEIHWAWKWGAVVLSSLAVIVFCYLLLRTFGLVLDFFFPLIFLGLHSGYEHVREWRHGAEGE